MKLRNKKTGESVEVNALGLVFNRRNQPFDLGKYASIKELTEEWEDYKPARPLIEDSKVRKVFREWADLHGAKRFRAVHPIASVREKTTVFRSTDLTTAPSIELPGLIGEDSEIYTKVELVGEEEEWK